MIPQEVAALPAPPETFGGSAFPWRDWLWPRSEDATIWEHAGRALLLAALALGLIISINRVAHRDGTDYVAFCQNGQHILDHGVRHPRSTLGRYWPSTDVPWMVMTRLPLPLGMAIWYLLNAWSWLGLMRTIERHLLAGHDPVARRQATLAAGLAATPLAIDGMCLGSFHIFMVWLMTAGLLRIARRREWSGGLLLGLAIWIKLLPLLGVGYLVWKRKWLPAAIAVVFAVAVDAALTLAAFGPTRGWEEHRIWWRDGAAGTASRQLTSGETTDEDRLTNQSIAVTVRRLFSSLGANPGEARHDVRIAEYAPDRLKLIFSIASGILAVGLAVYFRRSAAATTHDRWATEIALVSLATLWFSPVVWSYHPTAATPALALIFCRRTASSATTWIVAGLWLLGLALLGWPTARAAGDLLWLSLFVGAVLVSTQPADRGGDLQSEAFVSRDSIASATEISRSLARRG